MSLLTLFLFAAMMMLLNLASISSKCTISDTLKHVSTKGNKLVLCDHGRKIYVRKQSDLSFVIRVPNCNGNFDEFALKALSLIDCFDGLVHTQYLPFIEQFPPQTDLTNDLASYYAYGEISDWY